MDSFNGVHKKGIIVPQRKIYLSVRLLSSFGTTIISRFLRFVNIFSKILQNCPLENGSDAVLFSWNGSDYGCETCFQSLLVTGEMLNN